MLGMAAQAQDPRERMQYLEKAYDAFSHKNAPELASSAALVKEAMELTEIQITKLPPNMKQLSLYVLHPRCCWGAA